MRYTVSFMDDPKLVRIMVTLTPSLIERLDERRSMSLTYRTGAR